MNGVLIDSISELDNNFSLMKVLRHYSIRQYQTVKVLTCILVVEETSPCPSKGGMFGRIHDSDSLSISRGEELE